MLTQERDLNDLNETIASENKEEEAYLRGMAFWSSLDSL